MVKKKVMGKIVIMEKLMSLEYLPCKRGDIKDMGRYIHILAKRI